MYLLILSILSGVLQPGGRERVQNENVWFCMLNDYKQILNNSQIFFYQSLAESKKKVAQKDWEICDKNIDLKTTRALNISQNDCVFCFIFKVQWHFIESLDEHVYCLMTTLIANISLNEALIWLLYKQHLLESYLHAGKNEQFVKSLYLLSLFVFVFFVFCNKEF